MPNELQTICKTVKKTATSNKLPGT